MTSRPRLRPPGGLRTASVSPSGVGTTGSSAWPHLVDAAHRHGHRIQHHLATGATRFFRLVGDRVPPSSPPTRASSVGVHLRRRGHGYRPLNRLLQQPPHRQHPGKLLRHEASRRSLQHLLEQTPPPKRSRRHLEARHPRVRGRFLTRRMCHGLARHRILASPHQWDQTTWLARVSPFDS